jgi:hypothetical protein
MHQDQLRMLSQKVSQTPGMQWAPDAELCFPYKPQVVTEFTMYGD